MVGALTTWDLAISANDKSFKQRKGEVDGRFSAVGNVITTKDPPNEGVIKTIHDLIDGTGDKEGEGLKQKVLQAWTFLYEKQTKENPLPKALDDDFQKHYKQLEQGKISELSDLDREQYQRLVKAYVCGEEEKPEKTGKGGESPKAEKAERKYLFEGLDLRRPKDNAAAVHRDRNMPHFHGHQFHAPLPGPGAAAANPDAVEMVGVLDWDPTDLDRIKKQFVWEETPDTQTVRLAQEDLWVYEALLRIIENTNKDEKTNKAPTSSEKAAIKRIESLEIGQQAARRWAQDKESVIAGLAAVSAAPGPGGGPARQVPRGGIQQFQHSRRGGIYAGPGLHNVGPQESPLADRYVDDRGDPLAEDAKSPYAELFKMMPINLRLVIDQKKVTKLLAECGNANMPIVVRTVRLRPGEGETISALTGAGAAGSGQGPATTTLFMHRPSSATGEGEGQTAEPAGSPYLHVGNPRDHLPLQSTRSENVGNREHRRRGGDAGNNAGRRFSDGRSPMKAQVKLKLDKDSLQQFFLENVEKMVFGVVALGALFLIWQALTQKGYDKRPEALNRESAKANKKIDDTPPWAIPPECHSAEFEKLVKRVLLPIKPVAYEYGNPWDNPVVPPLKLRPKPDLFAAEDLCGTAGVGAFAAGGAHGGQGRIGMRYVVLTALVPLERQTAAYQKAFDGVTYQIPQNDAEPVYARFNVKRVVVPSSGRNHEFNWEAEKPIDSAKAIFNAKRQWQGTGQEIVDPRFLYGQSQGSVRGGRSGESTTDPLVFPLGPTTHGWGTEVAHLPEIPP